VAVTGYLLSTGARNLRVITKNLRAITKKIEGQQKKIEGGSQKKRAEKLPPSISFCRFFIY